MSQDWGRVADHIRAAMVDRGWNRVDLAAKAGVGVRTVDRLLKGHQHLRTTTTLTKVERALGWEPGTLQRIAQGGEPESRTSEDREQELEELLQRLAKLPPRYRHRVYMKVLREWLEFQEQQELRDEE